MLKAICCNTNKQNFDCTTSIEQVREIRKDPNIVLWLDLEAPSEKELAEIALEFDLHALAIEDATKENQRPKIEEYEQFYLMVFYTIDLNKATNELQTGEIDMFLGKNYLITVHQTFLPELKEAEQRWTRNGHKHPWGIGVLLYSLLDTIVDHYFPVIDALVDQAEELEDRILLGKRQSSFTIDLLELKKQFLTLRRIAGPQRDVLNVLTNRDNPLYDEHVIIYFRDVYDHITRIGDSIDMHQDQLSTIMDANLSIVSNDLNQVMRTLTATSILLMVNALIAGIYGMNFDNMPELHWEYGYFAVLALMLGLTIVLIVYFKRLKWF